jgi:peptidoglycan hydrolase-like protein with peptidoglycan-binding domain
MKSGFAQMPKPQSVSFTPAPNKTLQRKCACGGMPGPTGECEECSTKKRFGLQTKLKVNTAGDIYEQEADSMAEQVVELPGSGVAAASSVRRMSSESGESLHRGASSGVEAIREGFKHPTSGGRPLPDSDRRFFEPRFGWDFSKVRIHSGDEASVAARSVNALAYTMRNDVVFGEGQYRPGTDTGRKLLAHELAHTIQQAAGGAPEIQRKHNLTADRFAGDKVLEAVYDNKRVLEMGDKGEAVTKIQEALLEAGFSLPNGANGKFDLETKAAVEAFQRASGLGVGGGLEGSIAKGIDGVVGATTMGWLDQRFSAGPSPPGKTRGATPGCATIKTVNVDIVSLDGSTGNGPQDLAGASSIFNQCCVRFAPGVGASVDATRTRDLLGGDNILEINPALGDRSGEEVAMFTGATADFNLSSRIRAFYVGSLNPSSTPEGHTDAYSLPPAVAGSDAALSNMVVITNTASARGLAHEFGHILLNEGSSAHQGDPDYLMSPAGEPPGERLTPDECKTIFDNA